MEHCYEYVRLSHSGFGQPVSACPVRHVAHIAENLPTIEDWIPDDETAFEKSMKQARQEERFFAADTADFSRLEYDEDVPF